MTDHPPEARSLRPEPLASDDDAREARKILQRLDAMEDPYAMHRVLENFAARAAAPSGAEPPDMYGGILNALLTSQGMMAALNAPSCGTHLLGRKARCGACIELAIVAVRAVPPVVEGAPSGEASPARHNMGVLGVGTLPADATIPALREDAAPPIAPSVDALYAAQERAAELWSKSNRREDIIEAAVRAAFVVERREHDLRAARVSATKEGDT